MYSLRVCVPRFASMAGNHSFGIRTAITLLPCSLSGLLRCPARCLVGLFTAKQLPNGECETHAESDNGDSCGQNEGGF